MTFIDEMQLVASVMPAAFGTRAAAFGSRGAAISVLEDGRSLVLEFSTVACTTEVTIRVRPSRGAVVFVVDTQGSADCDAMAVTYAIAIDLARVVEPATLIVTNSDSDAISWGLLGTATDGIARPLLVVDRSRHIREIEPLDPMAASKPSAGVSVTSRIESSASVLDLVWARRACDDATEAAIEESQESVDITIALANTSGELCGEPVGWQALRLVMEGTIAPGEVHARQVVSR